MAVLISIKPKYCELIANGKKTIEVRKTRPKCETPFTCYIYCSKDRNILEEFYTDALEADLPWGEKGNCKVIGEFVCDKIITVDCDSVAPFCKETTAYIGNETCLSRGELWKYTNGRSAYGWHISDLKIYDTPKELSKFRFTNSVKGRWGKNGCRDMVVRKPPQSWCYVERCE